MYIFIWRNYNAQSIHPEVAMGNPQVTDAID